jgi:hypothetical protein
MRKAKVEGYIRPMHDLRHTMITNDAATNSNPFAVMMKAGHKAISTTNAYIHLAGQVFHDEAEALERRMLGGTKLYRSEATSDDLAASERGTKRVQQPPDPRSAKCPMLQKRLNQAVSAGGGLHRDLVPGTCGKSWRALFLEASRDLLDRDHAPVGCANEEPRELAECRVAERLRRPERDDRGPAALGQLTNAASFREQAVRPDDPRNRLPKEAISGRIRESCRVRCSPGRRGPVDSLRS